MTASNQQGLQHVSLLCLSDVSVSLIYPTRVFIGPWYAARMRHLSGPRCT